MSPYLKAHEAYHRGGAPWVPWCDALDFHLQHGVVISNERTFLMARPVVMGWHDHFHATLHAVREGEAADGWHVWSAAGALDVLLDIARGSGAEMASYQRRTARVHRVAVGRLAGGISPRHGAGP